MRRIRFTALIAAFVLGAVIPALGWARPDNGWIQFRDQQPASPQTGSIDSGFKLTFSTAAYQTAFTRFPRQIGNTEAGGLGS